VSEVSEKTNFFQGVQQQQKSPKTPGNAFSRADDFFKKLQLTLQNKYRAPSISFEIALRAVLINTGTRPDFLGESC